MRYDEAYDVRVPCYVCGQMVRYAEATVDFQGPPFKAYYHRECESDDVRRHAAQTPGAVRRGVE